MTLSGLFRQRFHFLLGGGLLLLAACGEDGGAGVVQGYVEGEYLRIGLPSAGRVVAVTVAKGALVTPGQPLFSLDADAERAALAEAGARLDQARFQRDNLLSGRRPEEIRVIEAQREQAEASLKLSSVQLARQRELVLARATPQASVDAARAAVDRDRARVAELAAQLAFAREGARAAEIAAAKAAVEAATASVRLAEWKLAERTAEAPKAGRIEDVLYRPGEEVAAGQPVVSLLPPDNVLLRAYLGVREVARLTPGARLAVACEGCPPDLAAVVDFVSPQAAYAPPILYSREGKDKLVFLVEARTTAFAESLRPGQPVTLTLPGATP